MPLTGSVGWACYPWIPEAPDAFSHDDVLRVADRALYAAKAGGRNQAVAAVPAPVDDATAERAGALLYRLTTTA